MVANSDSQSQDDGNEPPTSASRESGALGPPSGVTAAQLAVEVAELKTDLARARAEAEERLAAWQRARPITRT